MINKIRLKFLMLGLLLLVSGGYLIFILVPEIPVFGETLGFFLLFSIGAMLILLGIIMIIGYGVVFDE